MYSYTSAEIQTRYALGNLAYADNNSSATLRLHNTAPTLTLLYGHSKPEHDSYTAWVIGAQCAAIPARARPQGDLLTAQACL